MPKDSSTHHLEADIRLSDYRYPSAATHTHIRHATHLRHTDTVIPLIPLCPPPHPLPLCRTGTLSLIDNSGYLQIDLSSQQSAAPHCPLFPTPNPTPTPPPPYCLHQRLCDRMSDELVVCRSLWSVGRSVGRSSLPTYRCLNYI